MFSISEAHWMLFVQHNKQTCSPWDHSLGPKIDRDWNSVVFILALVVLGLEGWVLAVFDTYQ